jgi:hypothetical protein
MKLVFHVYPSKLNTPVCATYSCVSEISSISILCSLKWLGIKEIKWGRSQWPRCLRRRCAAAWLLGSRVRIPLRTWMFITCVYMLCVVLYAEASATG